MNENKAKKVMELIKKVIYINSTKGTKLVTDLNNNALHIYDVNNGCESVMDYKGYTNRIYFDEFWNDEFDNLVSAMHEALDKYLEVSN